MDLQVTGRNNKNKTHGEPEPEVTLKQRAKKALVSDTGVASPMPLPPRPTLYTDRCGSPRLVPGCPPTTRRPPHRPAAKTVPTRVSAPGRVPAETPREP